MAIFPLHRRYWLLPPLTWGILALLSYGWSMTQLRQGTRELVLHEGRFVFGMIQATREWNARHGGVYGLMDTGTPANPYLDVPERDLTTPAGRRLTLLNPAYMTRQLGDVIHEQTGIRIHITSLNPLNPSNAARDWEVDALRSFDDGMKEYLAMPSGDGVGRFAHYAAPLVTVESCLRCHGQQGYRVGDIRGGITVVYPIDSFLAVQRRRARDIGLAHIAVWLSLSALGWFALRRVRAQWLSLQTAMAEQDALVAQRTAELRAEVRERQEAEASLRMLIDASGEGIFGIDRHGRCSFCNPVAAELLGYRGSDRLLGRDIIELIRPRREDGRAPLLSSRTLREGVPIHEDEAWFARADGSLLAVEYRAHPILDEGEPAGAVVTFADITERKQQQDRIWRQANYDVLTGLPNRELLRDRLDGALAQAQRRRGRLAVLFVDLDEFKQANDRLGHAAGDHILREVARRMLECLRDTDTVARLGGDEFVIVLPFVEEAEAAEKVAAKLVETLSSPYATAAGSARISASIGIAYHPDDADTHEELIRRADEAMYRAKQAGRNGYRAWRE